MAPLDNDTVNPDKTFFKTTIAKVVGTLLTVIICVWGVSWGISSTYGTIVNNQSTLQQGQVEILKEMDNKVDKSTFNTHVAVDTQKYGSDMRLLNMKLDNIINNQNKLIRSNK